MKGLLGRFPRLPTNAGKTRGDGPSGQAEVLFSLDKVASMVAQGRNFVSQGTGRC